MKDANHRRIFEEQRKWRIFNAKERKIGLDKKALDAQVHDNHCARERNKELEKKQANDTRKQDELARNLQNKELQEIKELNKQLNTFRLTIQKPENRRDFDLYDPNLWKREKPPRISDSDLCPISGIQKLEGEDLNYANRLHKQRDQVRNVLLQQMQDNRMRKLQIEEDAKNINYEMMLKSRLAWEMSCKGNEDQKNECKKYNEMNLNLALQRKESRTHDKMKEKIEDQKDIDFNFYGDFLSENPSVARNVMHPSRVLPNRWKGMSNSQLDSVFREQKEQIQKNKRKKEEERLQLAMSNEQVLRSQLTCRLLDTKEACGRREFLKRLEAENQQLALRQKEEKDYLYRSVYTNIPSEDYFAQFNTSSR